MEAVYEGFSPAVHATVDEWLKAVSADDSIRYSAEEHVVKLQKVSFLPLALSLRTSFSFPPPFDSLFCPSPALLRSSIPVDSE